jgi:3-isopropylmalate/(R)-2-methylmalate dehydratase small subunit
VLCVALDEKLLRRLHEIIEADPSAEITVDLGKQQVSVPTVGALEGFEVDFDVDQHTKHCLINGLDDIGLTLAHESDIAAYESRRPAYRPLVPTR